MRIYRSEETAMKQSTAKSAAGKSGAGKRAASDRGDRSLKDRWPRLHQTDLEPFPDETLVAQLAAKYPRFAAPVAQSGGAARVAGGLQRAWQEFHAGEFLKAVALGEELGALGASVANKSAAVHCLYSKSGDDKILKMLHDAMKRGDLAVQGLPDYANAHYNLALVIGRFGQRISILKALAQGLAGRVREHLERALKLEPRHPEAHVAMGLYHAEIIGKLGAFAAKLTYQASARDALAHFQRAIKLAPDSPIALMEYANGLLLLDARSNQEHARELYAEAAALEPADAMEERDVARAKRGIQTA
jgi:tetratricopeptide (TPR) repeat protein